MDHQQGVMKRAVKWTLTDVDQVEKSTMVEVDREKVCGVDVNRQRSMLSYLVDTDRRRRPLTIDQLKSAACLFQLAMRKVDVDSCLFLSRQQAALFITPHQKCYSLRLPLSFCFVSIKISGRKKSKHLI